MRILIVDDDKEIAEFISETIRKIAANAIITTVYSQASAIQTIASDFYDLIIVDLKIPTEDVSMDEDPAHGIFVFEHARQIAPGTPVIVLTGSSGEPFIDNLIEHSQKADIWGGANEIKLVNYIVKTRIESLAALLQEYLSEIASINAIEISRGTLNLTDPEKRMLRIFTRKKKGSKVAVQAIDEGLSGAKVLNLKITNQAGETIINSVCKLGNTDKIKAEVDRYQNYASRLLPEATPRDLGARYYGAKDIHGAFYSLAEGFDSNVFSFVQENSGASNLLGALAKLLEKWCSKVESKMPISVIRQRVLSDEEFENVKENIDWCENFESDQVQVNWGCAHGDLHGLNVLVSNANIPILIDFGDTGEGPTSLDPITLELSFIFHPKSPFFDSEWPTIDQCEQWGDLGKYLQGCPYPELIDVCRKWAHQVAAGDREVAGVAYAYLMRQFKFPDTNKAKIKSLLCGVKLFYDETF